MKIRIITIYFVIDRWLEYYCFYFSPLSTSFELKDYLETIYASSAQYNDPPHYPVNIVCGGTDGAPSGSDILSKIFAGVVAYIGNQSCYVNGHRNLSESTVGWRWQVHLICIYILLSS
jgi:lysosomal Pro-X carboxypeptidase